MKIGCGVLYNVVLFQIQLSQSQLQAITMQMQGKQPGQPIVIQTNQANNQDSTNQTQQQQQQQFSTQVSYICIPQVESF